MAESLTEAHTTARTAYRKHNVSTCGVQAGGTRVVGVQEVDGWKRSKGGAHLKDGGVELEPEAALPLAEVALGLRQRTLVARDLGGVGAHLEQVVDQEQLGRHRLQQVHDGLVARVEHEVVHVPEGLVARHVALA
eukprot:7383675-Prymnesium_polylepis.2